MIARPPLPPFVTDTAAIKARMPTQGRTTASRFMGDRFDPDAPA